MSNKIDDSVVKSFKFTKSTDDLMQDWIDAGYFESETDIAYNAYQILFKVMEIVQEDKKVIDFHSIEVAIEIKVPSPKPRAKRVLQ